MSVKNIVLFGQTGAGKSSVVNLMAGEKIAKVSPDLERCTLHWQEYTVAFDGHSFKVFDTVGFEEPDLGVKEYLDVIANAYNLIAKLQNEGGIHLLLFCVRAGRFTSTIPNNYRLVYEWLCEKKVPIVLVLTGLEREQRMDDWWTKYKPTFDKYGIVVDSHACITSALGLEGRHRQLYEQSRRLIRQLVIQYTHDDQAAYQGGEAWYRKVARKLWAMTLGKIPKRKNIETVLTNRCGMPPEAAKELAQRIRSDLLVTQERSLPNVG